MTSKNSLIEYIKQIDHYTDETWNNLLLKDSYEECDGARVYRIALPETWQVNKRYTLTCDYLHGHWIVDVRQLIR